MAASLVGTSCSTQAAKQGSRQSRRKRSTREARRSTQQNACRKDAPHCAALIQNSPRMTKPRILISNDDGRGHTCT